MPEFNPPVDNIDLAELVARRNERTSTSAPDAQEAALPEPTVEIPINDVVVPPKQAEFSQTVEEAIAHRQRLVDAAVEAQAVWARSSEKQVGETDQQHQERIKREFEAAVLAVRRQEEAPPLPPMPVPKAIAEQTRREMEAGRRQSEYWKEQQKLRPLPTAKEIQAAGMNTPVFRPGEYMHEKGGVDKHFVRQNTPGR